MLFRSGFLSEVVGVELSSGRRAGVKARPLETNGSTVLGWRVCDAQLPTVEMLWEPHYPRPSARGEVRLGGRRVGPGAWVAATVHDHWGIRIDACERIVISDRNAVAWVTTPAGRLLAKWSVAPGQFPRLSQVAELTRWLNGHGLPVSAPLAAPDGRLQVELEGVSLSLQRVVLGELLDVGHPGQVRAAGVVLARLRRALADYPAADQIVPPEERPEPWPPASEAGSAPDEQVPRERAAPA